MADSALLPSIPVATALLSREASASARALRSWSAGEKTRAADVVAAALRAWSSAWGVREAERGGSVVQAFGGFDPEREALLPDAEAWSPLPEGGPGLWVASGTGAGGRRLRAGGAGVLDVLATALFGEAAAAEIRVSRALSPGRAGDGRSSGVAADVVDRAWADWGRRLRTAGAPPVMRAEDAGSVDAALRAWSGALLVRVPWCGGDLLVLAAYERVARWAGGASRPVPPPGRASVVPLGRALAGGRARLRVSLLAFDLDLGALSALRVGDVLRTTHALDAPVALSVEVTGGAEGAPVCAGFLGRLGDRRAVELLSLPHQPPRPAPQTTPSSALR